MASDWENGIMSVSLFERMFQMDDTMTGLIFRSTLIATV